jgi:neopullulanase
VFAGFGKRLPRTAARAVFAAALAGIASGQAFTPAMAGEPSFRDRPPEDEVVYFLLPDRFDNADPANDRGGLEGGRLQTGFDPTSKGFFEGGDLKGVLRRLDYIQGLGATAIWIAPIFKNKAVQGAPGQESAGYHGYWITDFTDVDPHFGTKADFKALVDAAHARGMKIYLDIVANHTADVIRYRECPKNDCPYRSEADYPYVRRGGVNGPEINAGFQGTDTAHQSVENFSRLTRPDWAYTPYVPAGEEHVKKPDWLNDPIYYHNRGATTWFGQSAEDGDFVDLDDLFTENPKVVQGFIDIYGRWIDEFGIDGFRVDTARHVNAEFWRAFIPAMRARARVRGIPNFHIFGEVADGYADPAVLAGFIRKTGYPAVLDFAFQAAAFDVVGKGGPTERLARLYAADALYEGGTAGARRLPEFVSNHDMGRFAMMVRKANPSMGDEEVMKRVILGHALMFFTRGQPVVYSGDEQGFAGTGGDQDARQSMFASQVEVYNKVPLVGTNRTTAVDNFNPDHPIYQAIAEMAALRKADPALRRGEQSVRASGSGPGLFAISRRLGEGETLVVFNTSTQPITAQVKVDYASKSWRSARGHCEASSSAPGSYRVTVAPLDYLICSTTRP